MKENQFAAAQKKREQEQALIKKQLGLPVQAAGKRKVRLDVTLPAETKAKLMSYAEGKGLSVSVVVQMLIDEACT